MTGKVFAIGFNKCGTTSLHVMFRKSGLRSSHFRHRMPDGTREVIALRMHENETLGLPLLDGIDDATFYCDMDMCLSNAYLSGIGRFRELDRQYPGSRFILNLRDPANWLRSRSQHRQGGFLRRAMEYSGVRCPDHMRRVWLGQWHDHIASVRSYFRDRPQALICFDIERDDPARLARFFADLNVQPRHWSHRNKTTAEPAAPATRVLAAA